jgi:hypothetical protein
LQLHRRLGHGVDPDLVRVTLGCRAVPRANLQDVDEAIRRIEEPLRTSKMLSLSFRFSVGSLMEEGTLRMRGSLDSAGEGRMRRDVRLSPKHASPGP